ncbi:ABC transporter ATP-binding protein [Aureimonas sp. SK2]|uniref:ABC transporter ATP-binding protein n=1 Tax=Aureimonas sp. SK2 TaxID=3015992 RepID=UPI00244433FF|nr:ABC transporter ATP-binding protein [Aureimonas sp. SK2]
MSAVLETSAIEKRFGGLVATNRVSLSLAKGARHALIGPNGAGKTTLINLLTGVLSVSSGTIRLEGEDITHLKQDGRVRRGLARTFQINQLFADLTPLETICLAISERERGGGRWWAPLASHRATVREASEIIGRFLLADVCNERTGDLAYGKQRLLEIATAVALKPRVLLLDEPAAGVPEEERHEILGIVKALPADVTILLIEHDMDLVFAFADRISVLVSGALLTEGTVAEIAADPRVRTAYLGEDGDD